MKLLNKHIIVSLMLISQLLLSVFIMVWLHNQYNEAYNILSDDLQRGYVDAEQSMLDSLIAIHIVDPVIRKNFQSVTVSMSSNSVSKRMPTIRTKLKNDSSSHIETIKIVRNNKSKGFYVADSSLNDSLNQFGSHHQILEKSVGLFIEQAADLGFSDTSRRVFLSEYSDTLLLKNNFHEYMKKAGYDFYVYWKTPIQISASQHGLIELKGNRFLNQDNVYISGYRIYLIKKIGPQILFALILLIITTISFRISYLSIRKQQHLLQLKNELISNIGHELKTPVATVKVALESLVDFDKIKDPKIVKEYLGMSVHELNRLENLVGKVLNNSMLDSKQQVFMYEEVDLAQLIREIVDMHKYRLKKSGAEIYFESSVKMAITNVDKTHIQGVLLNLIDNSLKYGGEKVQININLNKDKSYFHVKVSDNGPGIPEEYIKKVFDKFFRIPSNDRHNIKGYGLGLNYARLVIEQHQGKIRLMNLKHGGCEFNIYLPIINEED